MFDNTLSLTAFCSPSHFPGTPPSVFRDHLPSKLRALKSLSQGLPGELKPRHLGSSAHDYQESLGCSWPDSPCILLGFGSPAPGCTPHQEVSPALVSSLAWSTTLQGAGPETSPLGRGMASMDVDAGRVYLVTICIVCGFISV